MGAEAASVARAGRGSPLTYVNAPVVVQLHKLREEVVNHFSHQHCEWVPGVTRVLAMGLGGRVNPKSPTSIAKVPCDIPFRP